MSPRLNIRITVNEHTTFEDIADLLVGFAATMYDPSKRELRLADSDGRPLDGFAHPIEGTAGGIVGFYVVE